MEELQHNFQVSSTETALCNHVILRNIFKDLSVKDLKLFRLVNSAWCEAATHVLKKNQALKLRLHYLTDIETLEAIATRKTVPSVSCEWDFGCITQPNYDPCVVAHQVDLLNTIAHETQGETRGVSVYLAVAGERPLPLGDRPGLNEEDEQRVLHILDTIIFGVSNLVVLNLDLVNYTDVLADTQISQDTRTELQHLEVVHLHLRRAYGMSGYASICRYIFGISPNLKLITGARLSILDVIIECDKAKCLKALDVDFSMTRKTGIIEGALNNFLRQAPMLTSLQVIDIPWMWKQIMNSVMRNVRDIWSSIYRLFIQCRRTITSLSVPTLTFLSFPIDSMELAEQEQVFEQLRYLEFNNSIQPCQLLPLSFSDLNLNRFPILKHVKLQLAGFTGKCLEKNFPPVFFGEQTSFPPIPSVEKLELDARYDKDGLMILWRVFPNVKKVTFHQDIGNYVHSLQIWDLPITVESVTLQFLAINGRKKLKNLDEIFTGMNRNVLQRLPRDSVSNVHLKTASEKGIRKLPALKRLKIIFDVHKNYAPTQFCAKGTKGQRLENQELEFFVEKDTFTELSGLYALQPGAIKTFIYYDGRAHCAKRDVKHMFLWELDMQEMLMPLEPYAVIDPTYTSQLTKCWNRRQQVQTQMNDPTIPSCSTNRDVTPAESIPLEFPSPRIPWKWQEEDSMDTESY